MSVNDDSTPSEEPRDLPSEFSFTQLDSIASSALRGCLPEHANASTVVPLLDAVTHFLSMFGITIEQNLTTVHVFISELYRRIEALEAKDALTDVEIARRLSEPPFKRVLFDAIAITLEPDREEIALVLADLVVARLERESDSNRARYDRRAIRVIDDISTAQLLIVALVAFIAPAQGSSGHQTSSEAFAAMKSGDFRRYDRWLEPILARLCPGSLDLEDFDDLVALGLLEIAQNPEIPGTVPKQSSAIEGFLSGSSVSLNPIYEKARFPSISAGLELLHPTDDGLRLSTTAPIIARYWPTPLGFRLADPLIKRFTDLNTLQRGTV